MHVWIKGVDKKNYRCGIIFWCKKRKCELTESKDRKKERLSQVSYVLVYIIDRSVQYWKQTRVDCDTNRLLFFCLAVRPVLGCLWLSRVLIWQATPMWTTICFKSYLWLRKACLWNRSIWKILFFWQKKILILL